MRVAGAVLLVLLLAGCGQDGMPARYSDDGTAGTDQCGRPVAQRTGGWYCPSPAVPTAVPSPG